jgi:hypothetical protein
LKTEIANTEIARVLALIGEAMKVPVQLSGIVLADPSSIQVSNLVLT